MTLELLTQPAVYFPVTLNRGEGFRFEVRLMKKKGGAAVNLAGATMAYEIRAEDDPESELLSVANLDVMDDESGIYQHFLEEAQILEYEPAAVFGYGFVFFSGSETNHERRVLGRGPVRVR